ncbi:MAG: hypothetical protein CVU67_00905 [Deltaproteobacteria bacterium HGW-Deltaproteobacteria-24]|nr:MAG: hypothetical protein CVU67_00905 [Deltaproteobacteria bacterium HGW-Deltaproteobacteria-24]
MKKIVKMSLVAAVAVAGLTTANAKPLEEAIKNVDVSGTVVYRYNDYNQDDATSKNSDQTNHYKIGLNVSSKINDDVKLNTRFIVGSTANDFVALTANSNDTQANVGLSQVYFGYTGIANTTVNVGKQGLTTPWTVAVDSDGNEQTGTGILALSTVGPVTVAAAYFNQTNLNESGELATTLNGLTTYKTGTPLAGNAGANDIATIGLLGNVGPVALSAWYLDMQDMFDTYTLGAKASFDLDAVKLGADVSYTSLDRDDVSTDNDLLKVILTAKAGIVDAKYVYAATDKEGGITAVDRDAATSFITWNIWTNGKADADLHHLSVGVQALETLHVSANFTTMDYNTTAGTADENQEELYVQLVYNMSKNLSTYVRYGTYEEETDAVKTREDDYRGRLQVQYSF